MPSFFINEGIDRTGPLCSDRTKAEIGEKWERIMRKSRFMRMMAEHECRELPPLAEHPPYRK